MGKRRIDGIDLSHYQADLKIDWHGAKRAGVKFAYLKATESTDYVDPAYAKFRQECYDNGVTPGAYHFARPHVGNAHEEAMHFLKHADIKGGDMRPVLDLEVNNGLSIDQLTTWVHTWFETVFHHLGVRKGLLYTHFNLTKRPQGVLLWVARYSNGNSNPVVPHPFWHWSVWQFSDGHYGDPAAVPGVGHVDANTLHYAFKFVRMHTLRLPKHLGKKKPTPSPAPAPTPDQTKTDPALLNPDNYPNASHPRRGTTGKQITWLGERLVAHGFGKHYTSGPGPHWGAADRANVKDFQQAQGWHGGDADGYPGRDTLHLLAAEPKKHHHKPAAPVRKKKARRKAEDPVAKMVRLAHKEVGTHEGRSGGHWNNHQKYSPQVPGLEWSQNQPWCATFVSWLALKAGLADYFPRTASTNTGAAWFKSRGQWSEYPAIGAQVFYGSGNHMVHTGFVIGFDHTYVYTIEGNTNTNGSAEGDGVYVKKRRRRDAYVRGYGYPAIPGVRLKTADPNYYKK